MGLPGSTDAEEAELYRRFAPRVRLYGRRHLQNDAADDDLAQDVLLLTIERLRAGEVRRPEEIGSFILGTSRMMDHSERRVARRREALAARFMNFRDYGASRQPYSTRRGCGLPSLALEAVTGLSYAQVLCLRKRRHRRGSRRLARRGPFYPASAMAACSTACSCGGRNARMRADCARRSD